MTSVAPIAINSVASALILAVLVLMYSTHYLSIVVRRTRNFFFIVGNELFSASCSSSHACFFIDSKIGLIEHFVHQVIPFLVCRGLPIDPITSTDQQLVHACWASHIMADAVLFQATAAYAASHINSLKGRSFKVGDAVALKI